jgi:scyllo-inositol 2-dehydrogenase (NADP+)
MARQEWGATGRSVVGPRQEQVRVAVIGYGMGGALFHAPFIAADPRLDLTAVVTANAERRLAVLSRYPGTDILGRTEDLLNRLGDVDLVVISTPNATHADLAEAVLSQGTAVVVDKPVTPTAGATRRLATLALERGTWVVPFQNRRWDGDFRTVEDLVRRHELGVLHAFESRYERWQPRVPADGGRAWKNEGQPGAGTGILFDLGSHLIDQAVVLFGRPQGVYGDVAVRRPSSGVDDDVFVALHYPGGPRVHLWMSAVAADRGPRFRLLGDAAAYVKWGMDTQESMLSDGQSPVRPDWGVEPRAAWGQIVTGTERREVPTLAGSYQQFYAGMAALLLDGAPPPVDVADAIVTAEIIEAATLSSRTGIVAPLAT